VTNIVKHAAATEARVTIARTGQEVAIEVHDNGKGFVLEPPGGNHSKPRGFGLIGIGERTRLLGSEPAIQSAPGQGTTIKVTLRLDRSHAATDSHSHRG
jgi:signal transduction histidine kinase